MAIPPLREAVNMMRANVLATMLQTAGIFELPKSKDGKAALWMETLGDPERIRHAVQRLTPRCRKALQVLQSKGPEAEIRTGRYRLLLETAGLLEKTSRQRSTNWYAPGAEEARDPVTFEEVLAALLKHGLVMTHTLVVSSNTKLGFEGGAYVYIPAEIAAHLPAAPPADEPEQVEVVHTLPGSARTGQRDLYLYWSAARESPLTLTNAGLLRVGDLKRIAGQLLINEKVGTGAKEGDLRRLFFLRRLLTALKALQSDPGGFQLVAAPTPAFLQAEGTARVRTCFEVWRDGAWWNELWATYTPGMTRAAGTVAEFASTRVVHARQKVIEQLIGLARAATGRAQPWVAVDELSDLLRDRDEDFLIDREMASKLSQYNQRYYGISISPYVQNALGWEWEAYETDEGAGWQGIERTFIQAVLAEGLYWLGLVDLGYRAPVQQTGGQAPEGLAAVRLTDMGRWLLLGEAAPAIPAETGRVVVQPNFHIFAFDPIADSTLARLDTFASRLNAERAIEYELSRDSVYRAQTTGMPVPAIRAWLEEVTDAPLPQNVGRSLEEWQAAFERIVVRPAVAWLQAAGPELIDAVLADPQMSRAIIKRVDGCSALVWADQADALEAALLAGGELPIRTGNATEARQGSVTLDAGGRVRFAHAVPSLYTYAALQPLAEECDGGWCITPASVQSARRRGLSAVQILAELATLALNDVPPKLQQRVKAWAGHYGNASLRTVTLFQFRDQDTLQELLSDRELAAYLVPFKPAARLGLAAVAPQNVARVRAMLAERGISITGES